MVAVRFAPRCAFSSLLLAALFVLTPRAHAQLGLIGSVQVAHFSNSTSTQSTAYGGTHTSDTGFAVGASIYYVPLHIGPVGVGVDLRGSGGSASSASILFGVRVPIHPKGTPIRPYVEGLVGAVQHKNIYNNTSADFAWQIAGGLDYAIRPHVDWRVIEIGGGETDTGITTTSVKNPSYFTVSTGIGFRFF